MEWTGRCTHTQSSSLSHLRQQQKLSDKRMLKKVWTSFGGAYLGTLPIGWSLSADDLDARFLLCFDGFDVVVPAAEDIL